MTLHNWTITQPTSFILAKTKNCTGVFVRSCISVFMWELEGFKMWKCVGHNLGTNNTEVQEDQNESTPGQIRCQEEFLPIRTLDRGHYSLWATAVRWTAIIASQFTWNSQFQVTRNQLCSTFDTLQFLTVLFCIKLALPLNNTFWSLHKPGTSGAAVVEGATVFEAVSVAHEVTLPGSSTFHLNFLGHPSVSPFWTVQLGCSPDTCEQSVHLSS